MDGLGLRIDTLSRYPRLTVGLQDNQYADHQHHLSSNHHAHETPSLNQKEEHNSGWTTLSFWTNKTPTILVKLLFASLPPVLFFNIYLKCFLIPFSIGIWLFPSYGWHCVWDIAFQLWCKNRISLGLSLNLFCSLKLAIGENCVAWFCRSDFTFACWVSASSENLCKLVVQPII